MNKKQKYELYRWKWENYPKLKIIERVPCHLDIEITTRCNLKCIMCEHTTDPPAPLDLSLLVYKKIIDEFAEKGGCAIKLCYLGEPLLHKELDKMKKYAKDKGIIDVMLATNGNLLTKTLASKLIKSGLDSITFSIDSCKNEIYKQIRCRGDLDRVIEGLKHLNALKKEYNSKTPKIIIQGIPMPLNKEEIETGQYENFWKSYANLVRISPYCEDFINALNYEVESNFFCEGIYQRMTIRADGKIVLCCGIRKDNKILGDIREDSLEDVWLGKEFCHIRKLMNEHKSHLIDACKACSYRISRIKDGRDS